jgi:hypothetical protein
VRATGDGDRNGAGGNSRGGRRQAGDGRRGLGSTGDAAASEPLDDDQLNADTDVDAGAATKEGSKLSTSLPGEGSEALARDEQTKGTTEVDTQGLKDGDAQEAGDITNKASNEIDGGVNCSTQGQPQQDNGLQFDTQRAAGARQPDSEGSADLNGQGGGEVTLGATLEGEKNVGIEIGGNVSLEESSNGGLGVDGESTVLLNGESNGSTNRDGGQSTLGERTNGNETSTVLAVNPGKKGDLQVSAERAVIEVEPGKQRSLDISSQAANNTTVGADTETSPDISTKAQVGLKESGKGSLSRELKDKSGRQVHSGENTLNSHVDGILSSNLSASRDECGQRGQDISSQGDISRSITPSQKVSLEGTLDVGLGVQPLLEFSTSTDVNGASTASDSTTLESSSTVSTQTREERNGGRRRGRGTTTQDEVENVTNVDGDISEDISEEAESAAVVGDVAGRVGQRGTRQSGEQEKRGTHCRRHECVIANV